MSSSSSSSSSASASASAPRAPDEADAVAVGSRDHYQDAVLYDYEYRRRRADVNFYKQFALASTTQPGPILELACGSGRITVPLARAGFEVVGIDLARSMLHRAHERVARQSRVVRERISFVCADMRRFALARRFPLIVMAFNSFEHLYTREDVESCLACVREHLAPDGFLVFDLQSPNMRWLSRDADKRWSRTKFTHPGDGRRYVYTTSHDYDEVSQIALIRLYYQPLEPADAPEQTIMISQRKFFPAELRTLLHANGFSVQAQFGDFAFEPLGNYNENQVLVCQALGSTPSVSTPSESPTAAPEVIARIGLVRDARYMYFVKKTGLWRMPYGRRDQAERLFDLACLRDQERDPDQYVYFLDTHGDVVRVRR